MEISFSNPGIYNVDVDYLKHLHDDIDSEVYYAAEKYNTKPFLGIIVGIGKYTYFIPLSSSKVRHLKWKNVAPDHYLIYEIVDRNMLSRNAVFKPKKDNLVLHIIAALDIKKMIPVPDGLYKKIDFNKISDVAYKRVLEKEYRFCLSIQDGIIDRVRRMYEAQKSTGTVHRFYCSFAKLERACDEYSVGNACAESAEEALTETSVENDH